MKTFVAPDIFAFTFLFFSKQPRKHTTNNNQAAVAGTYTYTPLIDPGCYYCHRRRMDIEDQGRAAVPLRQEEIPPVRTDDPEYFWASLVLLVVLSIMIATLLFNHKEDPTYSN